MSKWLITYFTSCKKTQIDCYQVYYILRRIFFFAGYKNVFYSHRYKSLVGHVESVVDDDHVHSYILTKVAGWLRGLQLQFTKQISAVE